MNSPGTVERITEEFCRLLSPAYTAFSSEGTLDKFLRSLGISIADGQQGAALAALASTGSSIRDLVTALEALQVKRTAGPVEMQDYEPLLAQLPGAILALSQVPGQLQTIVASVPDTLYLDMLDLLVATYLWTYHETAYRFCILIGLIQGALIPAGSADPNSRDVDYVRIKVHWDVLVSLVSNPGQWASDLYRWGSPDFAYNTILTRLQALFEALDIQSTVYDLSETEANALYPDALTAATPHPELKIPIFSETTEAASMAAGVALLPSQGTAPGGADFGLALVPFIDGVVDVTIDLTDTVSLTITGGADIQGGIALSLRPLSGFSVEGLGQLPRIEAEVGLKLKKSPPTGQQTMRLIGAADSTRLETKALYLALQATFHSIDISAGADGGTLVLQAGDGDGFLNKVLPKDPLRINFDLLIGWSSVKGLYFGGGAGLEVTLPVHQSLFDVLTIDSIYLALSARDSKFVIVAAVTAHLALGPIKASVTRIGLRGELTFPHEGGNLGPANLALGFKPPDGAGLSINASVVTGGGFLSFDTEKEQYAGILYLEVKDKLALKAIGILTTRLPDGKKGFSLLIIITAEFPPIQLGYGFALTGVGGLLGLNRTMVLEVLRDGIKNKTIDSVLFPENPIVNAPRIISDLQAIFPPAENRFVLGPMAKIIWGGAYPVLSIELGILIELPSPVRLALLGKIVLALPKREKPDDPVVVYICLDILGTADFDKGEISIDGVLVDSRIALFTLTGGMALRLRWGSDPFFAVSIGGFNPRFAPPPGFPTLDRLALQLSYDKSGLKARLGLQTYLAVTANTLQLGARIDAYAEYSGAKLSGFLGFDALIEFHPFHLIVDLYGGVAINAFGLSFGVDLLLTLSGPQPWLGDGHVIVNFLGKHEFPIHFAIGDPVETPALPPVDPFQELNTALSDLRNWSAALPTGAGMLVTLRQLTGDELKDKVVAHPLGELTVRQNVLPLGIALERFGAAVPTAPGPYEISRFHLGAGTSTPQADFAVRDAFAPGQFVNLSEDEKLSRPGFEPFRCGQTKIGIESASGAIKLGPAQAAAFEYDVTIIDSKDNRESRSSQNAGDGLSPAAVSDDALLRAAQYGAARQAPGRALGSSRFAGADLGIKVRHPLYRVAGKSDLEPQGADLFESTTEAEAARRGAAGDLQVVEAHEVQ